MANQLMRKRHHLIGLCKSKPKQIICPYLMKYEYFSFLFQFHYWQIDRFLTNKIIDIKLRLSRLGWAGCKPSLHLSRWDEDEKMVERLGSLSSTYFDIRHILEIRNDLEVASQVFICLDEIKKIVERLGSFSSFYIAVRCILKMKKYLLVANKVFNCLDEMKMKRMKVNYVRWLSNIFVASYTNGTALI